MTKEEATQIVERNTFWKDLEWNFVAHCNKRRQNEVFIFDCIIGVALVHTNRDIQFLEECATLRANGEVELEESWNLEKSSTT